MAARESGYCTSFILMSARWDFQGVSQFPCFVSLLGFGLRKGWAGRLRSVKAPPRGYWGTFLVFFFRIWQCMKLATKEATTRTPRSMTSPPTRLVRDMQMLLGSHSAEFDTM